ncbi:MAG: hypothetical protein IJS46_01010 [Kiritimatiellae bacterium]|nr:hypothetical protein [Kiritimatiellia bacterium]
MTFSLLAALAAAPVVQAAGAGGVGAGDAGGAAIGSTSFSLSLDPLTGRLSAVTMDGRAILVDDPDAAEAVAFETANGEQTDLRFVDNGGQLEFVDNPSNVLVVSATQGLWRVETEWQTFPEDRMVRRRLVFEWRGDEPVRLKSVSVLDGKVPFGEAGSEDSGCARPAGAFILAGAWPPLSRAAAEASPGRVTEGSTYTPMAIADDGARSVMSCVDELRPFADYSVPVVTERADGFALSRRFETAGWIRPGEPQTLGDLWLSFRDGTAADHLRHTGDWFRKVGFLPPQDSPGWVRDIVACYSLHPCGRNDDYRCDPDGLALARAYLPYLEALGADLVWMRPIEDKAPYMPRDYYALQPGVGTMADLAAYVADAHSRGIRVWRDAVPHGGHTDFPRAKAHPEFLAWKEDGRPDSWWTYDYFSPGWLSMFSGIVRDLTAASLLDGWRIDVASGSRFPNWNPAVPYARGSFSRCQGALAMNRAIRAAARESSPDAATLGETTHFSGAAVCDSIYDFKPALLQYWRFTDTPVAECVRNLRRHLAERQAALPPGAVQVRYMENHDSHHALPLFGRAATTALFAMTAFCDGYPLIYQEAEDGCFEAMRRILRIRRLAPEMRRGAADYLCVEAPDGVFAVLRECGGDASVALVNFNGLAVAATIRHPYGAFECDLPPFGYDVRRVKGAPLPDFDAPAWEPPAPAQAQSARASTSNEPGGSEAARQPCRAELTLRDGSPASGDAGGGRFVVTPRPETGRDAPTARPTVVSESLPSGAVRYRVADLGGFAATNLQLVVRLPGATRWFAHTAEGDFESPFVVRHPRLGFVKSTVKHGEHDTAIRWTSALHPFGFTPGRACVGARFPDGSAATLSGFDARRAEVVVLDRLAGTPGLAIAIRADSAEALSCDLMESLAGAAPSAAYSSSFTGIPELAAVMGGWLWESGGLRLAIRRNGTLRAAWLRDAATGEWAQVLGTADIRTDTGAGRRDPFGNPVKGICSQNDAFGDPIRLWRGDDGAVHLDFGPGDLRPFHSRMADPVWYRTRYTLRPGAPSFELESAISAERDYAAGEGEIALRMDLAPATAGGAGGAAPRPWSVPAVQVAGAFGAPAAFSRDGATLRYRWLFPDTSFSPPKGTWHGVRLLIDTHPQATTQKEQTP